MDPYLDQTDWTSVHVQLAGEIARVLGPMLRPKYLVRVEKLYVLSSPDRQDADEISRRPPDVSVTASKAARRVSAGGLAVLEPPLRMSITVPQRLPQMSIRIRDAADRSLVTAIEILSMSNKSGTCRKKYLAKRSRLLASPAHLMEIDLLREGKRMPMTNPLPDEPYFVVLSRADRRPIADVWPISMRSALPVVPIPLMEADADVLLDLQSILSTMYDIFSYDVEVDYDAALRKPLPAEDAEWARNLIRNWRMARAKDHANH
jgi:hypothetical protein